MTIPEFFRNTKVILKSIALLIIIGFLIYGIVKIQSCNVNPVDENGVSVPADTNYNPVTEQEYTPPSTPLSSKKLPVQLPKGVREKDVETVTTITMKPEHGKPSQKFDIIRTKEGETFVRKDSTIESVSVTTIAPPFMDWGIHFGAGITAGKSESVKLSPSLCVAPVQWFGWLQAPAGYLDIEGVGPGLQAKVYHDIYIGAAKIWKFEGGEQLKLTIQYMF